MSRLQADWGLLGADGLGSARRVRTLDVGAAVRHFNDLAVPGMGGVWYGRQLLWPLLGVGAAEVVRGRMAVSNIEVANAVEALACRMALRVAASDPRMRGVQKLRNTHDLAFTVVRRSGFYVTQPMRMATVQPLVALRLVEAESERFNAFKLSDAGRSFIESACRQFEPCWNKSGVLDTLVRWVAGDSAAVDHLQQLVAAITPLQPLPPLGAETLREVLIGGESIGAQRRDAALAWVRLRQNPALPPDTWHNRPPVIASDHWAALLAGARFFKARDAALHLLDAVERHMGPAAHPFALLAPLPQSVDTAMQAARTTAQAFLALPGRVQYHAAASSFCSELLAPEPQAVLASLVRRDDRVLRLAGEHILAAGAFEGELRQPAADTEVEVDSAALGEDAMGLPHSVSQRMRNLFLLDLDVQGRLGNWLAAQEVQA